MLWWDRFDTRVECGIYFQFVPGAVVVRNFPTA